MRGLFLDTSTHTGWALFERRAAFRACGTFRLPRAGPEDYAGRTWPLFQWLDRQIDHLKPAIIGFESPFIPFGNAEIGTTGQTLRLQIALASTVEMVAKKHGVRCMEASTQSCKKAMIGTSRVPKEINRKDWDWKAKMLEAVRRQGWTVTDHHQADACAVGAVIYDEIGLNL